MVLLAGWGSVGPASAQSGGVTPDPETAFALPPGHAALDAFEAERRVERSLLGTAIAAPIDKLIALLDAQDAPPPRARYKVSFHQQMLPLPNGSEEAVMFVDVQRFNLGPALRRELVASLGASNVAPAADFGVGPHVSLRATLSFLRSDDPGFRVLGRALIDDRAAARQRCLVVSCTATASALDRQDWMQGSWVRPKAIQARPAQHAVTAADAARWLLAGAGLIDAATGRWLQPEMPEGLKPGDASVSIVIERDLGQDHGLAAVLRQGPLMDDDIRERWFRVETAGDAAQTSTVTLRRR